MHIIITYTMMLLLLIYEKSFKMGVLASKSDNTTYYRAGSFERRLLFEADNGCNGCSMIWGLQCTRFHVDTMGGMGDMYNILLLNMLQGGCIVRNDTTITNTRH